MSSLRLSSPQRELIDIMVGVCGGIGLGIALHPFYLKHLIHKKWEEVEEAEKLRKSDKLVVEVAIKYRGVVSPLCLVNEAGLLLKRQQIC